MYMILPKQIKVLELHIQFKSRIHAYKVQVPNLTQKLQTNMLHFLSGSWIVLACVPLHVCFNMFLQIQHHSTWNYRNPCFK